MTRARASPPPSPLAPRAYKFLVHPRVTSAPIEKRIAFLTAKDCTPEEIEEALAMTDQQSAETSALLPRPGAAPRGDYGGGAAAARWA